MMLSLACSFCRQSIVPFKVPVPVPLLNLPSTVACVPRTLALTLILAKLTGRSSIATRPSTNLTSPKNFGLSSVPPSPPAIVILPSNTRIPGKKGFKIARFSSLSTTAPDIGLGVLYGSTITSA